jgi:peptide-methionine (R)-S-oxide reductase
MPSRRQVLSSTAAGLAVFALGRLARAAPATSAFEVTYSDEEWRKRLTPEQYHVLRQSGTERPYTSSLLKEKRRGTFTCAGCSLDLFASETKYDSGTGWPSFWEALDKAVVTERDTSLGMTRTAVNCRRCGGHLGHVFDDGPQPTGQRYCMNGLALGFKPAQA